MNVFELMGSIELKDENFIRGVNNARRSMQQLQTAFNNSTRTVDRNVDRSMQNAGRSSSQGARRVETASDNMSQSLRQANRSFDSTARTASRDFDQLGTEAQRGSRRVEDSVDDAAKHSEKSVGKMSAGMIAKAQIMAQAIVGIVSKVADGAKQIATSAIEGYGNYQQLTGGIQKLYGNMGQSLIDYASANGQTVEEAKAQWQTLEKAQNTMIRNAKAGWKTAGMSANDYMQNVTGFSAALINSLGGDTQKAADIADMAMQDISDNVNTFGTGSVQDIADVYRAISKGQYQTLDNLNLGFAGTKEGMQKLIDKANELQKANGKAGELSVDSFSDIVEAIHEVQGSMSITGTTSREAMGTVEGSINMAKSAWQNLVAGLGDKNADITGLTDNLIEALGAVKDNLAPIAKQIWASLKKAFEKEIGIIADAMPEIIGKAFDKMSEIGSKISEAIKKIKPEDIESAITSVFNFIVKAISTGAPKLLESGASLIKTMMQGVGRSLPEIIPKITAIVTQIAQTLVDNASQIADGALELMLGMGQGIINAIPDIVQALPQLISEIVEFLVGETPTLFQAIQQLFMSFVDALPQIVDSISQALPQIIDAIVNGVVEGAPLLVEGFLQLGYSIWQALPQLLVSVAKLGLSLGEALVQAFVQGLAAIAGLVQQGFDAAMNVASSVMNGIENVVGKAWDAVNEATGGKLNAVVSSVSEAFNSVKKAIGDKIDGAKQVVSKGISAIKGLFNFHWKLPDIQVPKFKIDGGTFPYGLGGKGRFPNIDIVWHAKAMNAPMLLTRPTIFGMMGDKYLAGGEAGPEVVSGVNPLLNMMRNAASSGNGRRDAMLSMIVELLSQYLPDISTGQDPEALFQAFDRRLGEAMI